MKKPSQTLSASYLDKLVNAVDNDLKIDLADYVASNLLKGDDDVFVASGTTAAIAAVQILYRDRETRIYTHSVPTAWHVIEFVNRRQLESPNLEIVSGIVNCVTGMIQNNVLGKLRSRIFVFSPHAIGSDGVTGIRDVEYLKQAWKAHEQIILLATYDKLLRTSAKIIKHLGHIKKEVSRGKRICDLVVPLRMPKSFSASEKDSAHRVMEELRENGISIHLAPQAKESPWRKYLKDLKTLHRG